MLAQRSYISPHSRPVYVDRVDPVHDIALMLVAADDAAMGQVTVHLTRGVYDPTLIDHVEYVAALRRFADHLACYASDYEFAATLEV